MAMGFDPKLAERALRRANNDWDVALTMLTSGMVPEEDEFDILADAQADGTAHAPADRKPVATVEVNRRL